MCTLISLLLAVVLLSGCVKGDYHITVNWDGSIDVDYIMALDKVVLATVENDDPFAEARENAEAEGYTVEPYDDGRNEGLRVKKHFENAEGITFSTLNNQLFDQSNDVTLNAENLLFTRELDINTDIDLRNQTDGASEAFLSGLLYSQADVKLRVTLPIKPKTHNADTISEDGKTLEWEIELGENNPIQLNVVIPNMTTLLIGCGILLFIGLALSLFFFVRRRRLGRD